MKHLAFFGGSFDPVRNTHFDIALAALFFADRVFFIPAPNPPHKNSSLLAPYSDRREMIRLAIEYKGETRLEISDVEKERAGKSYTFDTLEILSERYRGDKIYCVIGSDSLMSLHTWYRAAELVKKYDFLVYPRIDAMPDGKKLESLWGKAAAERMMSFVMNVPKPGEFSSTLVRDMVKKDEDISSLVPPPVEEYIRKNALYR